MMQVLTKGPIMCYCVDVAMKFQRGRLIGCKIKAYCLYEGPKHDKGVPSIEGFSKPVYKRVLEKNTKNLQMIRSTSATGN